MILGRIGASDFLGGEMPLDHAAAEGGIEAAIATPLGLGVRAAADAILRIAIAKMSLAVRQVSVEKGHDPRDFALVASGGAGPLHAVAIARELHIPTVVIPRFPAHFSALGMLMAGERHDFIRTHFAALEDVGADELSPIHDEMVAEARGVLKETDDVEFSAQLDLRYVGQEFSIPVPVTAAQLEAGDMAPIRSAFDALHEHHYAHHAPDEPVEMVNIRLTAFGRRSAMTLPTIADAEANADIPRRPVYFDATETPADCPVYPRDALAGGASFTGPALVQEYASTTVVFAGDRCAVADTGELIISVGSD